MQRDWRKLKNVYFFIICSVIFFLGGCALLYAPFQLIGTSLSLVGNFAVELMRLVGRLPIIPPGVLF